MCTPLTKRKKIFPTSYQYILAIVFGIVCGLLPITIFHTIGTIVSDIFIKMFKCISLPIIAFSIITTVSNLGVEGDMQKIGRRTFFYTITTTIVAAVVSCVLYILIGPTNVHTVLSNTGSGVISGSADASTQGYINYLLNIVPSNIFSPFLEHQVISALFISIIIAMATRSIANEETRHVVIHFFKGIHSVFLIITSWIVKIIPLALFGFITTTVIELKKGSNFSSLSRYLWVVILSNIIQGVLVLPILLKMHRIAPFKTFKIMMPALSVAFFSKSSTGTLPITMETMEKNLGVSSKISRLVLPLCTSINMNGCASFIFTTVIYLMQNNGTDINLSMMIPWIFIATIAAIGNAGVPMGCFFLSASLLTTMNVPITLLGMILPIYSIIDMVETALNVWSDACITKIIDKKNTNDKKSS